MVRKIYFRVLYDAILGAIETHPRVPTRKNLCKRHGGVLAYSARQVTECINSSKYLTEALEMKGVKYVRQCSDEEFAKGVSGKWGRVPAKVRSEIKKRLDKQISDAIKKSDDIPTCHNLCKKGRGPLPYSTELIRSRLKARPYLRELLENTGADYVCGCSRIVFDKKIKSDRWRNARGKARREIDKRLDGYILEAIKKFEGIPTRHNISKEYGWPLPYPERMVRRRLKCNAGLNEALETRGIEYVRQCSDEEFTEGVACKWNRVSAKVRREINKRLDGRILEAIKTFKGIPTHYSLSKEGRGPLEYGDALITSRIKSNKKLKRALEKRGIEYVRQCSDEEFAKEVAANKWNNVPAKVRSKIKKRIFGQILNAILAHPDVPTPTNLSSGGSLPYGHTLIARYIDSSKTLTKALETTGIAYVKSCSHETFVRNATSNKWHSVSAPVRKAIEKRMDDEIYRAIKSSKGVPTPFSISKTGRGPLPYSQTMVRRRIGCNGELENLLETTGIARVTSCSHRTFVRNVENNKWNSLSAPVRSVVVARIDAEILPAIHSSKGIVTPYSLSKAGDGPLPYGPQLIATHISNNQLLRKALKLKNEGPAMRPERAIQPAGMDPVMDLEAQSRQPNPLFALADRLPTMLNSFKPLPRVVPLRPQPSLTELVRRLRQA